MAEIVKITKGQPFVVYVPLVIMNMGCVKEVDADSLTNVQVNIIGACTEFSAEYHAYKNFIVIGLPDCLIPAEYSIEINATLDTGRPFALRIRRAFEVVNWDEQSNWRNFIVGDHIELRDQPFIIGAYCCQGDIDWDELLEKINDIVLEILDSIMIPITKEEIDDMFDYDDDDDDGGDYYYYYYGDDGATGVGTFEE